MISLLWSLLGNKYVGGFAIFFGIFIAAWTMAFYKGRASVDVPAIERAAYEQGFAAGQYSRDKEWQAKLDEANNQHQRDLQDAITERDTTPAIVDGSTWADELCRQSSTCRDKGPKHN